MPTVVFSQLTETIITDTTFVRCYISEKEGDTVYYLTNNRPIGKWIIYYDSLHKNKVLETEFFEKREDIYNETLWYSNGQIKSTVILNAEKDTSFQKAYYLNNIMRYESIYYWNKSQDGWRLILENKYYRNGQITETSIDYTSLKKQHIIAYYENGEKHFEMNWVNGTLVGGFKEYFENGKIKQAGDYSNPSDLDPTLAPSDRPSTEIGKWKFYNEKGDLIKVDLYDNGKLISTTENRKIKK